jgi:Domain of unknown function (DUF6487)
MLNSEADPTCPRCGALMEAGWVFSQGLRWSTEKMGLLKEGENLFHHDPGFRAGPNRTATRCAACCLVMVNYEDRG